MTCHSVPGAFGEEWLQEPVDLSSHDPLLPKFCQYNNHPLWPHGKAFIYEADTSPKAQLALLKHAKDRKIVGRFEDDLKQQGELQLLPKLFSRERKVCDIKRTMGEQVTYRDTDHTDPRDDVIQLWVSDGRLYDAISPTFKDEVTQLRDDVLGPENERQHGSPRKATKGEIVGGFNFERSFHRSRPVRDDSSRCYQCQGLSTEKPRAISSVNANSKLPDDKDCQLRNRMLKMYAAISVAAMKLAPESVQRAAQLKADLVNSPFIVQDDNFYHHESQINMLQAQMYDGPLMITDLGPSGDRHNDNNDKESGYSNTSVHSHLPVEYHPGLFMFYELGLRYHGGTPPTAPPGVTPPAWNTWILIIQYPARHLMNMSVRQSLAALPGRAILYVTLEMQEHRVPKKKYRLWSTRATDVTDGYDLMS
ncbi:hypothetical protein K439DRAFT_1622721 [Ramaria rubella]|nr:hypothetical protein K439DRAFT_1622721 [Ramaria rubella]